MPASLFPSGPEASPAPRAKLRAAPRRSAPAPADLAALKAKALRVHAALCREHGCPIPYFHALDPLSELVSSFLNHRTRNADAAKAFKALRAALPTWEAVRDADPAQIEPLIAAVRWPEMKAPRLVALLRAIDARTLAEDRRAADEPMSLDFLGAMTVEDARAWLEQLPGVGRKTSAAALSFSTLRGRALPVDSHHHRVAARLGLIPATLPVGPAHDALAALMPPDWDAQTVYDHHQVLMRHGQNCCFYARPACGRCAVLGECPAGQARIERGSPAPGVDENASRT